MTGPVGSPAATPPLLNIANVLTGVRLLLVPVFVAALLAEGGHNMDWRLAAFGVFALAAFTDQLDGELARRRDLITTFGTIADPIADKALTGAAFAGLSTLGLVPWWITLAIMSREVGITVLRFAVLRHGVIPANRGGKLKTLVQALAIALYLLPLPELLGAAGLIEATRSTVLVAALALTVITGLDYVVQAARLRAAGAAVPETP